jgi:lysozyme
MIPRSRPQAKRQDIEKLIKNHGIDSKKYPVVIVGVRGYYLNTMGKVGENARGIYDDAIFIVTPNAYVTFNGNTDPSIFKKGTASLPEGKYMYKIGTHNISREPKFRYKALVQAEPFALWRDEQGLQAPAYRGINIHKGGNTTTGSLGCQTIPPAQWQAFISLVEEEMKSFGQKEVPYLLVCEKTRRK